MTNHPPTGSQPLHRDEATRSWWMDETTREGFREAAEREQQRMARSKTATQVRGVTIGWGVSGRKP